MYNSNELGALSDRELLAVARQYEAQLGVSAASLGFTPAEELAIKLQNDQFESALDDWDAAQAVFDSKKEAKNDRRKATLAELRDQRNRIYANKNVSDAVLASYNLPPRDTVKTDAPAPSSAPFGLIDYGKLKHTIHFRDAAAPDRKAKPAGMQGCEIWHFIGTAAPLSEKDFSYLATDTNSPYEVTYEMEDAGKKVFYLLRWLSKSGERGEWSETLEATING